MSSEHGLTLSDSQVDEIFHKMEKFIGDRIKRRLAPPLQVEVDRLIPETNPDPRPDPKPDLRPDPRHYGYTMCFTGEEFGFQDAIGEKDYKKALEDWHTRNARPMPKDFGYVEESPFGEEYGWSIEGGEEAYWEALAKWLEG